MTEPHLVARGGVAGTGGDGGAAATAGQDTAPTGQPAGQDRAPGRGRTAGSLRTAAAHAPGLLRRHWLVALLLAAGLALRVLAVLAYRPALIYVDTLKYLYGASPGSDPIGYTYILRAILVVGNLTTVVVVQHLAGLAMAAALYAVLLRRGLSQWLAALAVAPVLLDAYQVQIEQMIMPDLWFEAFVVAGLCVLLWRPAPPLRLTAAAGLLLGASATVHQLGEVLALPAVFYLLATATTLRRALTSAGVLIVAFLVPILGYCTISYASTGHFWLARGQSDVGRVVAAADCATLQLPADVRPLCPTPHQQSFGPDWLEHSKYSPLHAAPIPAGASRAALTQQLTSAIWTQQPERIAGSVGYDSLRLFAVTRTSDPFTTPLWRWQFQTHYPVYPNWVTLGPHHTIVVGVQTRLFGRLFLKPLKPAYGGPAQVNRPLAGFLRSYQLDGGYTPGPLFAVLAVLGVAGSVLALARRSSADPRLRAAGLACLLFTLTAIVILLGPDVYEFSWRYQLPAVFTLPPAGLLGLTVLLGLRRRRKDPADPAT
ncbi:MAG TPA: hypothetical protein VMH35_07435 [Streptosporangiaceae bacterium]|nr:hypothetical protein [Streptosporangiaceae bacterium]